MDERFMRAEAMLGSAAMRKLEQSRVAVVGLGGVGSWCAEALARCGVGELILLDQDAVSVSNRNRQLCALEETVGREKTAVMAERVRSINPDCRVHALHKFYGPDTARECDLAALDYVVDAIDTVTGKLARIAAAKAGLDRQIARYGDKHSGYYFTVDDEGYLCLTCEVIVDKAFGDHEHKFFTERICKPE